MLAYVALCCRVLLAVVFVAAAATKVRGRRDLEEFRAAVRGFGVTARWSSAVAGVVIALESAAAAAMLVDAVAPAGLGLAAGLLAAFTAAIVSALRKGTPANCRCFGASARPLGTRHVVRNGILLLVAVAGAVTTAGVRVTADARELAPSVLAGFVAVVLALLVIAYDDLASLAHPRGARAVQNANR
ncbi:methylamine utilization protein MauE [Sphaerisporangium krabiense]|uniref:Cation transporter-like permease n=1 Tax=Sphaerisporangium krabiense TaxID=763782 RepID=A0A7W8Z368_9ACTN|nr:MauE/DoxX family redox-associated membrane protein [Sphaerisporangium krabiense]MBB5626594.1 cation transporter-like permease [Sphaerisporangium krabiense]GII63515.1 methylamine utilization protein MauE [Sphaerisporangium krabiense]